MSRLSSSFSLTQRAIHAVGWSFIEISIRYFVQFCLMVVLARLLTPSDFGIMSILLAFTSFAAILIEGGLGSALIQRQTTDANDETSVFLVNLGFACTLSVLLWCLAPFIAAFFSQPTLAPFLRVLLWALPLGALATVPNAVLTQRLDFRRRATAELLTSFGSAAVALWLAMGGCGVWSLVWQMLTGALLRATLLWLLSGWRPLGQFDRGAFARLFRFGGWLLLANTLNVVSFRFQSLLIGRLFDAKTLGIYSMAQDTQQVPAQFMSGLLNRIGLPMFSSVAKHPTKLAGALRLALRLSMFVFAPCMAGIAVMAQPLVKLLYGSQWDGVAHLLTILSFAALFWPVHVLNLAALSAVGRADLVLKMEISKGLISIPLVWTAAFFGVIAVAWTMLGVSLVCVLLNTWHSQRLLACGLRTQLRDLAPIMLLALLSSTVTWLSLQWIDTLWLQLVAATSIAAVTYLTVAVTLRMQAWLDFLDFLRVYRSGHAPTTEGTLI